MQLWCVDSLGTPHKVRETDSHLSPCENAGTKIIHAKLPCTMVVVVHEFYLICMLFINQRSQGGT